ncbi:hypothetical protein RF11_07696 [Thelohanellus kitauei]|uniref:Uncharacterized protein n=1 Tax=Thelohanellus kitauei TaxID=669202 RepID=A0A0C2JDL3_THEKT|nr:hypothetical protein RF11_07696 [Thelohanellus kitauei]
MLVYYLYGNHEPKSFLTTIIGGLQTCTGAFRQGHYVDGECDVFYAWLHRAARKKNIARDRMPYWYSNSNGHRALYLASESCPTKVWVYRRMPIRSTGQKEIISHGKHRNCGLYKNDQKCTGAGLNISKD